MSGHPALPASTAPVARDFRRRRPRAHWLARLRQRLGVRLVVLMAAIAVPAMAAPGTWHLGLPADEAEARVPLGFEVPGESFPGSAFYYLADMPFPPSGAGNRPADGSDTALSDFSAGRTMAGPAAPAIQLAGSMTDRARALRCMTLAIYYEAATEPDAGQRAVAQVVLNRVAHPSYPDTVCGVVFQGSERTTGCQFSFTCDGSMARAPARLWWDRAERVARAALGGAVYSPVGLATHYHTTEVNPYWAGSLQTVGTIGAHIFYRWRGPAGLPAAFTDRYWGGEPLAAPHPRLASAASALPDADPLALARAYEVALKTAEPAPVPQALPASAPAVESHFEPRTAPTSGQVREEYARSGQWLRQPGT